MYIMFEKSLKKTKETSIKLQFPFQEKKKNTGNTIKTRFSIPPLDS